MVNIVEVLNYRPALRARKIKFVSVFTVPSEIVRLRQLPEIEEGV